MLAVISNQHLIKRKGGSRKNVKPRIPPHPTIDGRENPARALHSAFRLRLSASARIGNEGVWLSVVHEHRFRSTRKVKAEIFNPRTTFCRPGISGSPLIFFLRDWQYYYSSTAMPEGKPQSGILKIKYAFWHHRASSACLHPTTIPPPELLAEEFEEHLTFRVAVKPIFPDTVHKSCVCHRPVICRNSATGFSSYIFNMPKKLKSVTFFHDIFRFFFVYI